MTIHIAAPVVGVETTPVSDHAKNIAWQREVIEIYETMIRDGNKDFTVNDLVSDLNIDRDNSIARDWAVRAKLCTPREFERALHRRAVLDALDVYPKTASEFVLAMKARHGWIVDFNGIVTRDLPNTITLGDEIMPYTSADLAHPLTEPLILQHKTELNLDEIALELRLERDRLGLKFKNEQIADAVTAWHQRSRQMRLANIAIDLAATPSFQYHPNMTAKADAIWLEIANRVFDCKSHTPAFAIAVLKKFMWQVKRKLRGMPVTNHLMPVFLGPQGAGKSTFIRALLGPVKDITADVDFDMIEDTRNITLWNNYVLFLDEMGFASRADVDVIKNAISAPLLSRRVMHTNRMVQIVQNATFIGASNKELAQLIKDQTGMRRFAGIRFLAKPDWDYINQVNWTLLWGTVDLNGPDPTTAIKTELSALQGEEREIGRVEKWLADVGVDAILKEAYRADNMISPSIKAATLYHVFKLWQEEYFPRGAQMNLLEFGHEMSRLIRNHPEVAPFTKKVTNKATLYTPA